MNIFILKLILAPIIIASASLAGTKWGSSVNGWWGGLCQNPKTKYPQPHLANRIFPHAFLLAQVLFFYSPALPLTLARA